MLQNGSYSNLNKVLDYVKKKGEVDAIIAGGAVRDLILNKTVNDYDVYIKCNDIVEVANILKKLGIPNSLNHSKNYSFGMQDILFVSKSKTCVYPLNVDLVFIKTEKSLVDYVFSEFDFNICKVAFDGEVIRSSEFEQCLNDKIIKLSNTISNEKIKHFAGIHLQKLFYKFSNDFQFEGLHEEFWKFNKDAKLLKCINRTKITDLLTKDYVIKTDNYIVIRGR